MCKVVSYPEISSAFKIYLVDIFVLFEIWFLKLSNYITKSLSAQFYCINMTSINIYQFALQSIVSVCTSTFLLIKHSLR